MKENKKNIEILGLCQKTEKVVELKSDSDTHIRWHTRKRPQELEKEKGGL